MVTKLYKILLFLSVSILLNTFLTSCQKNNIQIKKIKGKQIPINTSFNSDSVFTQIITPYKKKLQHKIDKILCYNPTILTREEKDLESSLGNLYADICFQKADSIFHLETGNHIDFALFNYGGIRTTIPKGNITVKNIFELMPFENKLVVTKLSGMQTQKLFNYLENRKEAHPISHLKLEIKDDVLHKILIQNKPFDPSKSYFVLTHDYLQHGGDSMAFFKNPQNLFNTQYKVRDAIIAYLNSIDTLKTTTDNRFIKVN